MEHKILNIIFFSGGLKKKTSLNLYNPTLRTLRISLRSSILIISKTSYSTMGPSCDSHLQEPELKRSYETLSNFTKNKQPKACIGTAERKQTVLRRGAWQRLKSKVIMG